MIFEETPVGHANTKEKIIKLFANELLRSLRVIQSQICQPEPVFNAKKIIVKIKLRKFNFLNFLFDSPQIIHTLDEYIMTCTTMIFIETNI